MKKPSDANIGARAEDTYEPKQPDAPQPPLTDLADAWQKLPARRIAMRTVQPNHYTVDVRKYDSIDVYRVLTLYKVTDPSIGHAIKKLLMPGQRGAKDMLTDVAEAIQALQRFVEMYAEDAETDHEL